VPKCVNCGGDVPEDKNFCPQCGTPVSQAGAPGAQPPPPAGVTTPPSGATMPPPPPGAVQPPQGPPGGVAAPTMPPPVPQPPEKKGMSKGAKIAIALAVSAVVLIIIAVVLFVLVFANLISAPADVANDYVKSLNSGDLSTAYNYLTTRTQKQETRQGFESKVGPFKGQIKTWNTTSINVVNDTAQIVMRVTGTDGSKATWDMTLVKEDGKWKIDQVSPR
jgi:uncharacterized membrane protein YvbJ